MKKLFIYLKDYRKEVILSPLFKLLEALLELQVPLVMAAIIDTGIVNRDSAYVWKMGLALLGLGTVGLVVAITAQYFAAKAATGFGKQVRRALFAHIQQFSFAELDTVGTPTLINRLTTDTALVQTGVNMTLRLLLRSPFVVFGAMVMAFVVDARAALAFVVLIPVLGLIVFLVMAYTLPRQKEIQTGLDGVLLKTRETLVGVRVLRAFTKEEDEIAGFEEAHAWLTGLQNKVGKISALMNPLTFVVVNIALAALLWSGAIRVDSGALSQGAVVALVNYIAQILVELVKLANLMITISKALASAKRIEEVLALPTSMHEPQQPVAANLNSAEAVRFEGVCKRYEGGGEDAVAEVSFAAMRGQTIGIIGGTGSGKSTLVDLIPRFYDATRGKVLVDGVDVKQQDMQALRNKIAVVPQKATLFGGTIRENLCWGNGTATDEELWQALEIAQAADIVREKPNGLDERLEQGGRNVSGGQRQRLTIARALVKKAPILILDDSSSALDYATEAALRQALKQMADTTMFVVSQRASSVRFADLIVVLEDGGLAGSGTHEQLMESCAVYREIYEVQYPKEACR